MKIFVFLLLAGVIFLNPGCAGKSKVTVTAIEPGSSIPAVRTIEYGSVRKAMQNLDFSFLETQQLSDQQNNFSEALRLLIGGEKQAAEQMLRKLYDATTDSIIKSDVVTILSTLLFYQSRWAALIELDSLSGIPEQDSDLLLPRAYNRSAPESYTFISPSSRLATTFTATGVPTIEVLINGKKNKFLLDTGAGLSVVSSDLAAECNISPIGEKKTLAATSTSKQVGIKPAVIEELKIGELTIQNHPVIIIDQRDLQFKLFGLFTILKIEGILGWNAIQNLVVEIDYPNKTTVIKKPERFDVPNRNFFLLGGYPVVRLRSEEGASINFGLDTGARESWITDNLLKKLDHPGTAKNTRTIGSAGGWEKVESKVLPELNLLLNEYRLTFKKIGTRPTSLDEFVELDGVLGGDVFENGEVRIDFVNGIFDFFRPDHPLKR